MGNLQVIPEERNQGIGEELLKFVGNVAKCLGQERLYFYTSNFSNVEWYAKRGASIVDKRVVDAHLITIMQIMLFEKVLI